jgi:hypothetical protein
MFDGQATQGGECRPDPATTLSLVSAAHRLVRQQECKLLELAAHWADLHHPDSQAPAEKTLPGAEQGRQLGSDGTPEVLEFCVAEFGTSIETSYGSARALMADALDLRHRLPELWQLIMAGSVQAWKARKVAQATRHLSRSSAMHVDATVAPSIAGLPWARFETLLAAKIIEADPRAAEEQAKIWEAERFVRASHTNQNGLRLLIAKANAGDVTLLMATVNRIAEILRLQGDMESADVRRSKAIGILAQPALALQLLWDFRNEQRPAAEPQQLEDPIHNDSKAPFDDITAPPSEDLLNIEPDETFEAGPSAAQRSEQDPEASTGRGLIIRPPGVDLAKLRPRVMLHIHLSEEALLSYHNGKLGIAGGVCRLEGVGPITLGQVRRFLRDTGCDVTVQPVIDPQNVPAVDSYEIPRRIREAMFLRMPASCFPYATATQRMDLDHTIPYHPPTRGGPPGQTGVATLGPLIRFEHRVKTHGRWRVRQPEPGVWIWRPPHNAHYLVSNAGTYNLGDGPFARRVWRAAVPPDVAPSQTE